MIKEQLYNRTFKILVDAYKNGTLIPGHVLKCPIGNLVASNCGITNIDSTKEWKYFAGSSTLGWHSCFLTSNGIQKIDYEKYECSKIIKLQIDSTGYPIEILAQIEYEFEKNIDPDNYTSLDILSGINRIIKNVLNPFHEISKS